MTQKNQPRLTSTDENFAVSLADNCKTHVEWLSLIRFGLKTLMDNQILLFELIAREAQREFEKGGSTYQLSDKLGLIFDELGLKIEIKNDEEKTC